MSHREEFDCIEQALDGSIIIRKELTLDLEEADIRLIPHIYQAILKGFSRIVVLSNDTDVFVILL